MGTKFVKSVTPKLSFLFIKTLPNDCSHIEDVHLLFCARFIFFFFSFLRGVELRHFFPSEMLRGCLVCVICNSNSIHSFIFKLCIMIVHKLKMYVHHLFCACFINFFTFLQVLNLDLFLSEMLRGCLVCVNCNSNSIHYFIFKLCIMIVHTLKMSTFNFVHI